MDFNKLTIKSQEAVAAAQEPARRRGNPELTAEHLLLALLDQELFSGWQALRADAEREGGGAAVRAGRRSSSRTPSASFSRVLERADKERERMGDDFVSTEHLFLALEPVPRDEIEAWIESIRGGQRVTSQDPGGHLPGALEVRPRPDRGRRGGKARPGDRPRRGDPPRDPDPLAPHEEQPRADRRAGRRQDRDRRGPRAAHRRRRRARRAEGPRASGRSTSARCSPARSTAASSRSG